MPHIKASLSRLDKNMNRISSYVYMVMLRLFTLEPEERQRYFIEASDKFMKNKKYNSIRDEFDELSSGNSSVLDKIHSFARYAHID